MTPALGDLPSILTHPPPQCTYSTIPNINGGKWLRLSVANFKDSAGVERSWEVCSRCHHDHLKPDFEPSGTSHAAKQVVVKETMKSSYAVTEGRSEGVDVIATIVKNPNEPRDVDVLLVVQFRPPVNAYVIEFPSGLVDPSEAIETAALRELKEETGYEGTITYVSPHPGPYEPGITPSCNTVVHVSVTFPSHSSATTHGGNHTHAPPTASLEPDEWSLKTLVASLKTLKRDLDAVLKEMERQGKGGWVLVDSRVQAYIDGLEMGRRVWGEL
ncbi:hypothetical protein HDV05_006745 [Chytridiales sp. JEL 0842]|nr:hypothetical protein HDV05_006745 [Chytridiales sp. JEL 0842]